MGACRHCRLALRLLVPLPFCRPTCLHAGSAPGVFCLGLARSPGAIVTITRAGSNVPPTCRTTAIVEADPTASRANPFTFAMFLGLIGLAIAFDTLWLLLMLVPFRARHPLRRRGPREA